MNDHNHNQFATIQERHVFSPTLLNQFSFSFSRPLETETEPFNAPGRFLQAFPGRQDVTICVNGLDVAGCEFHQSVPVPGEQIHRRRQSAVDQGKPQHQVRNACPPASDQLLQLHLLERKLHLPRPGRLCSPRSPTLFTGATDGQAYGNRDFRDISLKPYIQDDWKVTRRLTVNMGFRYEFQTNPVEEHNNLHNLVNPPFGTAYSPGAECVQDQSQCG